MDMSPNTGKSTGGDKQEKTPTNDAGSSAVTPPHPAPPAAAAAQENTTPVNVAGTGSFTPRPVTTTPARTFTAPANVGDGNVGQSGGTANIAHGGDEQRVFGSSVIVHAGGSSVERCQKKKRNRIDHEVGGSSSKPRFEGPDMETPPPCCECGKQYSSWKALFGHMRSHPERQWRGVFPPPTFNPDESPEKVEPQPQHHQHQHKILPFQPTGNVEAIQGESSHKLTSTLLKIATGVLEKMGGAGPSSEQKLMIFGIDLNVAVSSSPPPPPPPPPSSPSSPPPRSPTPPPIRDGDDGHPILDLNKSPPQE